MPVDFGHLDKCSEPLTYSYVIERLYHINPILSSLFVHIIDDDEIIFSQTNTNHKINELEELTGLKREKPC